ncbi:coiled-coil domain-containing protein 34 [Lepisosteus oculatus]|uniref:coiled-coil domain-containing protein 34 n=1 Tax=Lepisosteus oculatus TaxID=7918 RepID=UPI0035F51CEF
MSGTPTRHVPCQKSSSTPCGAPEGRQSGVRGCDLDSTGDSTYSLLSPIYHDSFESASEDQEEPRPQPDPPPSHSCDIKPSDGTKKHKAKTLIRMELERCPSVEFDLTAWEEWIVRKAREERTEMQKRALKEMALKEEKMEKEKDLERKKIAAEEKLRDWLQVKKQQEKLENEMKRSKELEEMESKEQKRRETEEKAQQQYKEWLKKKKQEEMEKKQKEKEEASKREAELKERRRKAEEKFQEWLKSAKDKPRPVSNSFAYSNGKLTGYYDGTSYPAPSFYNPIPWKPIHNPPPEDSLKKNSIRKNKKPSSSALYRQTPAVSCKPKDSLTVGSSQKHRR